jgi:DNA-binding NtrC family response regulator
VVPQILIVEDEKNARVALVRALEGDHLEVLSAGSAEEGLARFVPGRTALVLTDLKLPGMDGLELTRELRKRDPALAVIVMTAFGRIELAVEAMRLGAYDFIEKPLDLKRVRAAVTGALEDRAKRAPRQPRLDPAADDFEGIIGRS